MGWDRINPVKESMAVCTMWLLLQFIILLMMDANCVHHQEYYKL